MIEMDQIQPKVCHEGEFWTIEAKWKCGLCYTNNSERKYVFNDKFEFEDHMTRFCHICNEELTSAEAINRHFATQHYEENQNQDCPFVNFCRFCGKTTFDNFLDLETHVKSGHPIYKCLGCDKSFLQFTNFHHHAMNCKSSWKEMISSFVIHKCNSCNQLSINLKDLYLHYLKCVTKIQGEIKRTFMSEENIKEAIKHRVDELRKRENVPYTLLRVPQSEIITLNQKKLSNPNNVIQQSSPFTSGSSNMTLELSQISVSNDSDLSTTSTKNKTKPRIIVHPTRKFHDSDKNTNAVATKPDSDPLTKCQTSTFQEEAFMSKPSSENEQNYEESEKVYANETRLCDRFENPSIVTIPKTTPNSDLPRNESPIFCNENEEDPLALQITSVTSVGNFIEDLDNPMDVVIEKILKLTSKRKDILEKIVMANSDSVQDILIKNGTTRLILENGKKNVIPEETSEYFKQLESGGFFWTDQKNIVHKFKPCSIQLKRLKSKNSKKTLFKITRVNIPTDYLPSFLNNFDILDSQGPTEKPRKNVINRPSIVNNISTEQVFGYQDNDWVTSTAEDEFENISMIVENPSSGETSQSWCGISSNYENSYIS